MKKSKSTWKRLLALALSVTMCLSGLPTAVLAEEETAPAYTQVTSAAEITSGGSFVLVAESEGVYYALDSAIGSKITAVPVTVADSRVTADSLPVWTAAASGAGVSLSDGTSYLAYGSGTNFSSSDSAYEWNVAESNGAFRFTASGSSARAIAYGISQAKFGAYSTTNSSGYVFDLLVFKSGNSGSGSTTDPDPIPVEMPGASYSEAEKTVTFSCPTGGVTYYYSVNGSAYAALEGDVLDVSGYAGGTEISFYAQLDEAKSEAASITVPSPEGGGTDEPAVVTIAEARAAASGTEGLMVEGTVIYISGRNVYIQDATGGIDLYFSTAPADILVGDVVRATGKRDSYNGLEELSGVTEYEKLGTDDELAYQTKTIAEILADQNTGELESTRVYLENAVVSAIDGSKITLTQDEGANTIILYGLPTGVEVAVGDTISLYAVVSDYKGYQLLVAEAADITIVSQAGEEEPGDFYRPENGDDVAIYYPGGGLVMTGTASGSRLSGTAATVTGDTLYTDGSELTLKVTVDENGYYTFTSDGRYLTTAATGNSLTLADAASEYSLWELEAADGGWYIKSVNARYNNTVPQYMEYYNGFTTYSLSGGGAIYTMQFFKKVQSATVVDSSLVANIAQWGGGGPYDDSNSSVVYGDKYRVGDMMDLQAAFTVVANGAAAQPYQKTSTGTGGNNYYMGGTNIGAAAGDYMQLALSTAGWGDMDLSFRLRATNAAPGSFQLQYSTDGGSSFTNFTAGEYSYAYTKYTSSGSSDVTGSGAITDGIARTSVAAANYVSFRFDVPQGAENADSLLIRLVAGSEKANGSSGTPSGNIRIDSVVLSGSPIVSDRITSYVSVTPDGIDEDQAVGTELTLTSATEGAAIFYRFVNTGDGSGEWQTYSAESKPVLPALPAVLEAYAASEGRANSITRSLSYSAGSVQAVKMSPNGGGVYIEEQPVEVVLTTATEGATIYYSTHTDSDGNDVYESYDPESAPILLEKGFGTRTVKAYAVLAGFKDSAVVTRIFTERSQEAYNIYFGQMHSHTSYSDGAGTAKDAYAHATNVENLDFLAVTDHSNSFDNADSATITDGSVSSEWVEGKALAEQYTTDTFVGLFGYEMTWSNGLGHINTFNTGGFQSRTQSAYTTYSTALQNYYATLKTVGDSISQFNHPGTTFGDFSDFAYYDEEIDPLITLIEVGNGEGAIGSSGYFPSYEYYTRALDKGWHVAPTNNQDNHKGLWGDANTARSVVLADSLSEEDIYDAMRNYRVYATEDNDLSIYYTLEGYPMGTILSEGDVDDTVTLSVKLSDPTDSSIGKVEVIANGGLSLASQMVSGNEDTVTITVSADYSYYYIKVTEADGDIAVTAPVWVGEVEAVGISTFTTDAALAVQNQELDLTLDLYNNEKRDFLVESIEFTVDGETIHTADLSDLTKVGAMNTASYTFAYTHGGLGATNIYATVTGSLNGVTKVYQDVLQLNYVSAEMVTKVVIDGTHYNDYVTGYYGGNMGNFTEIAAEKSVEVSVVTDEITAEALADCALLVISAPARKNGTANAGDYTASTFEDSFIELVTDYVKNGGSVVVCGLADYQDKNAVYGDDGHASVQLNKLLAAIGSSMRINDDEVYDPINNGGQFYRLYPSVFNMESGWTAGVVEGQVYSQYSGCSVYPGNGTWLVKGFDSTYSVDSDKDGRGNTEEIETDDSYGYNIVTPKGEVVFLACEDTAYGGTVFAAGGVFLSDFEVDADVDDYALPYANRTIAENILNAVTVELPLSTIAEVRRGNMGEVFRIRGYATAGRMDGNAFFDAMYLQDETGGITVFPIAEDGVITIGTPMEIVGYADAYQGDKEIQIMSYKILDEEPYIWAPEQMSGTDAMDYEKHGGQLIRVEGTVKEGSLAYNADGTLAQFVVLDENGGEAKVFIDGYILSAATGANTLADYVAVEDTVSAVGLLYKHPEGSSDESIPVLRVRNCDEVMTTSGASYLIGSGRAASVMTNVDPSYFTGFTVDGVKVEESNYALEDGSGITILTFTDTYLDTLAEGNHVVALSYTVSGSDYTLKAVVAVADDSKAPADPSEPEDPTEPADPSKPEDPTEPADPSEPEDPTEPADPSKPEDPTEPADPSKPEDPTEPAAPDKPTVEVTQTSYVLGSKKDASIFCNGTMSELQYVQMDGKNVDSANYVLKETSRGFSVTFTASYLETLSAGKHTVTLSFVTADGTVYSAQSSLTVAKTNHTSNNTNNKDGDRVKTGDDSNVTLLVTVLVLAAAALVILFTVKKKHQK